MSVNLPPKCYGNWGDCLMECGWSYSCKLETANQIIDDECKRQRKELVASALKESQATTEPKP